MLPVYMRMNLHYDMIEWKDLLDEFISTIPDTPVTSRLEPGLCDLFSSKPTNSLGRWIPHLRLNERKELYSNAEVKI